MPIVVDTSVLIDHLRGDERARLAIRQAIEERELMAASVLTKVELVAGMRPDEERATRGLLETFEWVEVDDELAERAGQYANRYRRSYPSVDPVDYVIAATAERLGAELWTVNFRHFPMFPELTTPY